MGTKIPEAESSAWANFVM